VLQESTRLHGQMTDLLDLTRLEHGAVPLRPEWCPADELVNEALQAVGARLARHRFAFSGVDEALLWGDGRLLHRALVNLLDNAVRHTPPGTPVEVRVQVGAHEWQLQVRDRGPGLQPGTEAQVFQKFHLGEAQRAGAGHGLGLPICAAVARLHGGRVEARSEHGLAVTLTLPQPPRPAASREAA
jgi:two-component system sensor histidine kinase KdpD